MTSEWQPIETAPKDGTRILVSVPFTSGAYALVAKFGGVKRQRWLRDTGGYIGLEPTHWQPLPVSP